MCDVCACVLYKERERERERDSSLITIIMPPSPSNQHQHHQCSEYARMTSFRERSRVVYDVPIPMIGIGRRDKLLAASTTHRSNRWPSSQACQRRFWSQESNQAAAVMDNLFFLIGFPLVLAVSSCVLCEYSFHFRQPSKSIRACMQPHSFTFRCNHSKLTGCELHG